MTSLTLLPTLLWRHSLFYPRYYDVVPLFTHAMMASQADRSIHDALCVIRCLVKRRAVIAGGGAPEIEVRWRHEPPTMTSRTSYDDVTNLLRWRHEPPTMTSRTSYYDVTNFLLWRHELPTMTSLICYYDVTNLLLLRYYPATMTSPTCY